MTDCRKCELNNACPGFDDCPKMTTTTNTQPAQWVPVKHYATKFEEIMDEVVALLQSNAERVPLTDERIFDLARNYDCGTRHENENWKFTSPNQMLKFARAIEAEITKGQK